jgi:hypothetical protein
VKKVFAPPPPPPSKGGTAKNLYTKTKRLILRCRVMWALSQRVNLYVQSTNNDTTEEDKNVCNIVEPPPDPRHLYRPPPPPPTALIVSMEWLSVETAARDRIIKFYFSIFSGSSLLHGILQKGLSQWPRGLKRDSAAAHLLEWWGWIAPGAWMVCLVRVVRCQAEVRASGWSLVPRSPTEWGECDCDASTMRMPWRTTGCHAMKKVYYDRQ